MAYTTKHLLANSLKEMLCHKTLDKITVKEICENCNVNRQTFYYNFQDVYDLIEWIFEDELEDVVRDNKTYQTWQAGVHSIFEYARANKRLILNTFSSVSRSVLERYLKKCLKPIVLNIVEERDTNNKISCEDKNFISDVYSMALIGIMYEWIESGMNIEYNVKLEKLKSLISGSMDFVIDKFKK